MKLKEHATGPIRTAVKKKVRPGELAPVLFPEMSNNPWSTRRAVASDDRCRPSSGLTMLELCAGAGDQALGYEQAGIGHVALVEIDKHACSTLRLNRPDRQVIEQDLNTFSGIPFRDVDVISGGLPCPPFSVAGKQLGTRSERNLFPTMIRLVDEIRPKAVGFEDKDRFDLGVRQTIGKRLTFDQLTGKTAEVRA